MDSLLHPANTLPFLGTHPNQRSKAGFVKLMAAALSQEKGMREENQGETDKTMESK